MSVRTTGTRAPAAADRDTPMKALESYAGTPYPAPARRIFHCPNCGGQVVGAYGQLLKCHPCRCRFTVRKPRDPGA